jgi:hypothetical protein
MVKARSPLAPTDLGPDPIGVSGGTEVKSAAEPIKSEASPFTAPCERLMRYVPVFPFTSTFFPLSYERREMSKDLGHHFGVERLLVQEL